MRLPSLIWGSPEWLIGAVALVVPALAVLAWGYIRATGSRGLRLGGATLKLAAIVALAACLLEPLLSGVRPRPGANVFAVVVDDSQSLQVRDRGESASRGDGFRALLAPDAAWRGRLARDFDERDFLLDARLRADQGLGSLSFNGTSSAISTSLAALARRFRGLPLAGVLLFTDGCRTDSGEVDWSGLPPVYPVAPPPREPADDIGLTSVVVTESNFEAAPVAITAEARAAGFKGETIVALARDQEGKVLDRQTAVAASDDAQLAFRFQFRPEKKGLAFVRVDAFATADEEQVKALGDPSATREQTLANNTRLVVVDQGGGPYRILYVGGRPNWEFKFLRRALEDDEQVQLVGLLRIAKRQPKFDFRSSQNGATSPLFDGFDHPDPDAAERADQPVLIRLGTLDEVELRDGFPQSAEELFRYHAIVIDDLEAAFFTPDQLSLVRRFVSERGGGLLMLGGLDSFGEGRYDRTPVGELLPVYLNGRESTAVDQEYVMKLTRDGWLQPWVRLRKTEDEERERLATATPYRVLSRVGALKPGAVVLAEATSGSGEVAPALAAQPFGMGRVAALLIGDLWRSAIRRQDPLDEDFDRAWRQTARWLTADVPDRFQVEAKPRTEGSNPGVILTARLRDPVYRPLDNAKASFRVILPGGSELVLDAEPDPNERGAYVAPYTPKAPGPYRAIATAAGPDGATMGERETGWVSQSAADEFAHLTPDREFLGALAAQTGGEVVDGARLDQFVASLETRAAPITEPWTIPAWHNPLFFLAAILCLAAEWGLRRTHGLP